MIRIFIADDHTIVREGLKQIILEIPDMNIAGEAVDGHEVLKKTLENDYDVVVLDITMPGINGLDVLKQIKTQKPKLPILMLSMHPEEQYAVRAIKAGAAGYLTKETVSEELVKAIRTASIRLRSKPMPRFELQRRRRNRYHAADSLPACGSGKRQRDGFILLFSLLLSR